MTNGEKIKEIFPTSHINEMSHTVWVGYEAMSFKRDWWNAEYKEPTTKNDLGVDCVSRKEVFETIDDCNRDGLKGIFCSYDDGERFKKYIKNLPSVTPQEPQTFKWCTDCKEYDQEKHCCHRWSKVIRNTVEEMKPKTGHWIKFPVGWKCSNCSLGTNDRGADSFNFCPNCGADMREVEE